MTNEIARRGLMRILGLAGVAAALCPQAASALPLPSPVRRLTGLLADVASARQVGQAYLQGTPGDADRDSLMAQLVARLQGDLSRETLVACCRADFADGRTVMVNGWMLSQTEARLCALAALT